MCVSINNSGLHTEINFVFRSQSKSAEKLRCRGIEIKLTAFVPLRTRNEVSSYADFQPTTLRACYSCVTSAARIHRSKSVRCTRRGFSALLYTRKYRENCSMCSLHREVASKRPVILFWRRRSWLGNPGLLIRKSFLARQRVLPDRKPGFA